MQTLLGSVDLSTGQQEHQLPKPRTVIETEGGWQPGDADGGQARQSRSLLRLSSTSSRISFVPVSTLLEWGITARSVWSNL